jgi:hypothetical protein
VSQGGGHGRKPKFGAVPRQSLEPWRCIGVSGGLSANLGNLGISKRRQQVHSMPCLPGKLELDLKHPDQSSAGCIRGSRTLLRLAKVLAA